MKLLEEIQAAAMDGRTSVGDLLRRCQVLAFRLRYEPLKEWVGRELNGYGDEVELAGYRQGLRGVVKAQTSGPFGRSAMNVVVPLSLLPDWYREKGLTYDFRHGIAEIEALIADAKAADRTHLSFYIPPEIYADLEVIEGESTIGMWCEVSLSRIEGIIDQIRNRALTFALELEAVVDSSEGDPRTLAVPSGELDRIFRQVIRT